jgi:ribosomal protein S18 acetylase RimI-like enzyme
MTIRDDAYTHSAQEFQEMYDLLRESYAMLKKPWNWLIARLENWRYANNDEMFEPNEQFATLQDFFLGTVHLWRDSDRGNQLVGFCIAEHSGNSIFLQVLPQYRMIEADILKWIESEWAQGLETVKTFAYADDEDRQNLLRQAGFHDDGEAGYMYAYDVAQACDVALANAETLLESGFSIQTLAQYADIDALAEVERETFGARFVTRQWLEEKMQAPGCYPEWNFGAISPEGKLVTFCLAWPDQQHVMAELDPIGTHPDYRQRGLAKATIIECFRRLREAGIKHAYISSAPEPYVSNRLYESLKPIAVYKEHQWIKTLRA